MDSRSKFLSDRDRHDAVNWLKEVTQTGSRTWMMTKSSVALKGITRVDGINSRKTGRSK